MYYRLRYVILILIVMISNILSAEFNEKYTLRLWDFDGYKRFTINDRYEISKEQKVFTITVGTMFLTSFFFDQAIRDFAQEEIYGGSNIFTEILYAAGNPDPLFYVFLTLYSVNVCWQNEYFHETMMLSLQSILVTQGFTEGSKKSFKRARPRNSPNDPFNFGVKGESFFSGHSSGAWAFFTVLATRHPETRWFSYPFAACVSLSRIYEDAHWTSDILLGALVGYTVGKWTAGLKMSYIENINILPYVDGDGKYVLIQYKF